LIKGSAQNMQNKKLTKIHKNGQKIHTLAPSAKNQLSHYKNLILIVHLENKLLPRYIIGFQIS